MAPCGRTIPTPEPTKPRTRTTRTRRIRGGPGRRTTSTNLKKKQKSRVNEKKRKEEEQEVVGVATSVVSQELTKVGSTDRPYEEEEEVIDVVGCCCSTPKGNKFRIPEISTCPPAPKKQRVISSSSSNCSLRRSPLSFFSPPDLDLFFFMALSTSRTDVSV
ncbi:hypothetical protein PIB30_068885 [Stylosanthes scabra]|uniref:Uncharacterized protein n=1 Tax=Stylosanthes scabra TaxID=79078 RepID=A0ABU6QMK5_9FABA|nr:hypothetical protein [Stylosanthes scabra]